MSKNDCQREFELWAKPRGYELDKGVSCNCCTYETEVSESSYVIFKAGYEAAKKERKDAKV